MEGKRHIQRFNEHGENLNISDVSNSKYSYKIIKGEENIFQLYLEDKLIGQSKFSNPEESSYFGEMYVEIYDLKIFEEYRGKGYSKILLMMLMDYLSKIVELVELHLNDDNEIAYNLYKSFGFDVYFSNSGYLSMFKRI